MANAVYGNVIIAETRELMLQEVDNLERLSRQVLDSVHYHNNVIESVNDIRAQLSPAFKKEKETDARLTSLEQNLGDIKTLLAKMDKNISSMS